MSFKIEFKDDIVLQDLAYLTPQMQILFLAVINYCNDYSLPLMVTSIKSDRKNIATKSRTHETFRAIDISTQDWGQRDIDEFTSHLNYHFKNIAAISYSDNKPRAAVYHDSGYGPHIHLQVRR